MSYTFGSNLLISSSKPSLFIYNLFPFNGEITTINLKMPTKPIHSTKRRKHRFEASTILSNLSTKHSNSSYPDTPASSNGTAQLEQTEVEVAEGYTITQFCDKIIEVFMNEKPQRKEWRKLLVFREEWIKYRESFYTRCRSRADNESDPDMKQKLVMLGRRVKKIDDEMERHAELLKEIEDSPTDINAVVAKRRKDFTGEFFRHLNLLSEVYDSLDDRDVNSSLKLDLELRKSSPNSISTEKSSSISYQRNSTATPSESSPNLKRIDFREALSSIKEGKSIESVYYVPLLKACIDSKSVPEAEIIHTHIIKTGTHEDLYIMTSLLNVYCKCGRMDYARKIFDKLPKRNVISRTALMTGYVQNWQPEFAIQGFQELLECGVYPTNYTIGTVLSACSVLQSVEFGKQIHGYIIKYHGESDTSMGNALCSLYSKCRDFESAIKAFWRIPDKNVISWTTAMSACGDNGKPEMGLNFFVEMLLEDVEPKDYTITNVLSLCCLIQASRLGEQIHSFTIKTEFQSDESITNSIMYLYLKSGLVGEARKLFDGMKDKSLVTWNSIIAGYAEVLSCTYDDLMARYSGTEALKIYLKLNQSKNKPDMYTFSSILTVCSGLVALEQGEQIHAQTIKSGFLSDIVVGTALVNMYNKCGSLEKATKAFVEMPTRTLVSWTSMITCYAQHGWSQQALQLFEDMKLTGVKPNTITFIAILSACSQAGMVNEALSYFKMMQKKYRIKPVMDHYESLIDMFVRLGKLEEAFDLIKKMDFEPNEVIWSILIAGCRSLGNMDLGFYAAERLLELKPKEAESYSLLSNMYRSAGRLEDVTKVEELMKEEKFVKVEDWSSISIKSEVYSFKPDDRSNYQSKEMYKLLEDFIEKAKGLGYVPERSLEVDDDEEDKENTFTPIVHHSEKLAVVFGLLNMPSGASIRILKSISTCRDCHNLIKSISVLTGREIIIRDSKRLHRFNDGNCSCGDFGILL